jgi:hypothetical protein
MAATVCGLLPFPSVLARGVPEPRGEVPDAPGAPDVAELRAALLEALVAPDVVPQRAEVPDAPVRDGLAGLGVTGAPAELGAPDVLPQRAEAPDGLAAPDEVELSERVLDGPAVWLEGSFVLVWPPFSSRKRADARPEPYTAWQADGMLPGPPAALYPLAPQIARDWRKLRASVEPERPRAESADHAPRPTPEAWAW